VIKMSRRPSKYDQPQYANVLPYDERRFKKAFYYIERLMELDKDFSQQMKEIKRETRKKHLSEGEANRMVARAVEEALERMGEHKG